ncbi:MAG: hypothetical protein GXY67_12020 [Clostridiales bacterium]|nr:hypothetical protein [Clostridiales bacterium]
MGAYDAWCAHKHKLRQSIPDLTDGAGIAYAVRHALAQVEQNTMAQQTDDLLRQQIGILFSCLKTSAGLLDVSVTTTAWVPVITHEKQKSPMIRALWVIGFLAMLAGGLYCYAKGLWIVWVLQAVAVGAAAWALLLGRKQRKKERPMDQVKVTLRPDEEKLFRVLDAQTQAIDRYINDFEYLNQQHAGREGTADPRMIARVADILEALCEWDDETNVAAGAAVERMLDSMGISAVYYSAENAHLFTVLPSKDQTKTMVPAIVDRDDHRLLHRGVAAVKMEEADAIYRI